MKDEFGINYNYSVPIYFLVLFVFFQILILTNKMIPLGILNPRKRDRGHGLEIFKKTEGKVPVERGVVEPKE